MGNFLEYYFWGMAPRMRHHSSQIMEDKVNRLIGVPVGFVRRHEADFTAALAAELDSLPDFRALALHSQVTLPRIGETVDVMSRSDTEKVSHSAGRLGGHHPTTEQKS